LPQIIVEKSKKHQRVIARYFNNVIIILPDIVGLDLVALSLRIGINQDSVLVGVIEITRFI
jgi:hypothetical protein